MENINVLHVYRTSYPHTQGGIEEVIRQLCAETSKQGVTNRIICLSNQCKQLEMTEIEGAVVYCYPQIFEVASCGFSIQAFTAFKQQAQWADIIHYQAPWPFADMMHVFNRIKTPAIVTYQSDIIRQKRLMQIYKPLMNYYFKSVKKIVATSDNYLKSSAILREYKSKTVVIANGIDGLQPNNSQQQQEIQQQLKQRVGESFLLFVGVLRYYKGLSYLLDALKGTDYPVVIAGFGPEQDRLQAQVKRLNLTNVTFLGYISDQEKKALYQLSKAIVFPSCERSEAYGITLVEASMHKRAMISTQLNTGTSYINLDGETGLVVEPKNSQQLRTAMDKLYQDDTLTDTMGAAAYKRYLSLFTSKAMGNAYISLYQQVLAENNESIS